MKKVRVLRLTTCGNCKELIGKLDERGVNYESFDADEHGELADKVEDFTGIRNYPIVIITSTSAIPTIYLFKAASSEELGESTVGGAVKVGHFTIDALLENLIGLIN